MTAETMAPIYNPDRDTSPAYIYINNHRLPAMVVGGEPRVPVALLLSRAVSDHDLESKVMQMLEELNIHRHLATPSQELALKAMDEEVGKKSEGFHKALMRLAEGVQSLIDIETNPIDMITRTDAERVLGCLRTESHPRPEFDVKQTKEVVTSYREKSPRVAVEHNAFGLVRGFCYPGRRGGRSLLCRDCEHWFTPEDFCTHSHSDNKENLRTVHWGLNTKNWREMIRLSDEETDEADSLLTWKDFLQAGRPQPKSLKRTSRNLFQEDCLLNKFSTVTKKELVFSYKKDNQETTHRTKNDVRLIKKKKDRGSKEPVCKVSTPKSSSDSQEIIEVPVPEVPLNSQLTESGGTTNVTDVSETLSTQPGLSLSQVLSQPHLRSASSQSQLPSQSRLETRSLSQQPQSQVPQPQSRSLSQTETDSLSHIQSQARKLSRKTSCIEQLSPSLCVELWRKEMAFKNKAIKDASSGLIPGVDPNKCNSVVEQVTGCLAVPPSPSTLTSLDQQLARIRTNKMEAILGELEMNLRDGGNSEQARSLEHVQLLRSMLLEHSNDMANYNKLRMAYEFLYQTWSQQMDPMTPLNPYLLEKLKAEQAAIYASNSSRFGSPQSQTMSTQPQVHSFLHQMNPPNVTDQILGDTLAGFKHTSGNMNHVLEGLNGFSTLGTLATTTSGTMSTATPVLNQFLMQTSQFHQNSNNLHS